MAIAMKHRFFDMSTRSYLFFGYTEGLSLLQPLLQLDHTKTKIIIHSREDVKGDVSNFRISQPCNNHEEKMSRKIATWEQFANIFFLYSTDILPLSTHPTLSIHCPGSAPGKKRSLKDFVLWGRDISPWIFQDTFS